MMQNRVILSILFSVIFVISIGVIPESQAFITLGILPGESLDEYILRYQNELSSKYSLWSIGNNLQVGDYYKYKICNDHFMMQEIYPYHCYDISLEFVTLLDSYKGKQWIVQSYLTYGNNTKSLILFVDPKTFDVTTDPLNVHVGLSLENTLFSLSKYDAKSLDVGTVWDDLDSYFTNKIPLEIKRHQVIDITYQKNIDVALLGYDVIVPSNHYIYSDFSFPVKSNTYSPHIISPEPKALYYFELLDYNLQGNSSSILETQQEDVVNGEVQFP